MCKCCKEIGEIKEIEGESVPKPDIRHELRAIIASYTLKKRQKTPKGKIEYSSFELKYCPMCGRKLN